jgi:hypothetical protein
MLQRRYCGLRNESINHYINFMDGRTIIFKVSGWIFGFIVFVIGFINAFWGNDPVFGAGIILMSFAFIPPAGDLFRRVTGYAIPMAVRIILGVLILWAALGVGELFDKTGMMLNDMRQLFK